MRAWWQGAIDATARMTAAAVAAFDVLVLLRESMMEDWGMGEDGGTVMADFAAAMSSFAIAMVIF